MVWYQCSHCCCCCCCWYHIISNPIIRKRCSPYLLFHGNNTSNLSMSVDSNNSHLYRGTCSLKQGDNDDVVVRKDFYDDLDDDELLEATSRMSDSPSSSFTTIKEDRGNEHGPKKFITALELEALPSNVNAVSLANGVTAWQSFHKQGTNTSHRKQSIRCLQALPKPRYYTTVTHKLASPSKGVDMGCSGRRRQKTNSKRQDATTTKTTIKWSPF